MRFQHKFESVTIAIGFKLETSNRKLEFATSIYLPDSTRPGLWQRMKVWGYRMILELLPCPLFAG